MKLLYNSALLTAAFFFCLVSLQAQKLKDKNIKLYGVSIPSEKLPDDYLTYSVKSKGAGAGQAGKSNTAIANGIKMDAFRRIEPDGNNYGHLRILLNTGYVNTERGERKSRTSTTKNKDGTTTTNRYYWYVFPMQISSSYKIVDPNGAVLAAGQGGFRGSQKGAEYRSPKAAYDNYSKDLQAKRREAANKAINDITSGVRSRIAEQFDFSKRYKYTNVYFIKKHDSEKGFVKAYELTKAFFENPENICMSSEQAKKELEAPIDFWKRYDDPKYKNDKKLKKLYTAANYNLALVYAQVDEYALAREHANKVIKAEEKHKRSSTLITKTREIESRLKKQNIASRRYCRDVSNAAGPAQVAAFEMEKQAIESTGKTSEGGILLNGDAMAGTFVQTGDGPMSFGQNGNTKFKVEENNQFTEYELTDERISKFNLGSRDFIKRQYTPSAKGESVVKNCILEEVYTSEKISLYQYYPTGGELSDDKTEFAFAKAGDEMPISLLATQFLLWKKGLAKYFEDCPDLSEMCGAGEIEMNRDDLIKAARIYSELCD